MSSNRPAFAKSLVAMYGSSPETSDDENPDLGVSNADRDAEDVNGNPTEIWPNVASSSEGVVIEDDSTTGPPNVGTMESKTEEGTLEQCNTVSVKESESELVISESSAVMESAVPDMKALSPSSSGEETQTACSSEMLVTVTENADASDTDQSKDIVESLPTVQESIQFHSPVETELLLPKQDFTSETNTVDGISVEATELASKTVSDNEEAEEVLNIRDQANMKVSEGSFDSVTAIQKQDFEILESTKFTGDDSQSFEGVPNLPSETHDESSSKILLVSEKRKRSPSPDKSAIAPGGRRLRQVRNPSAKAAEAAADAAFVAAVTPTRKNLKEAKIACALAKVSETTDVSFISKKSNNPPTARTRKSHSSSHERSSLNSDLRTSPLIFTKEDSNTSDNSFGGEGKLATISEEDIPKVRILTGEDAESLNRNSINEVEKPIGIKLKISGESVQILDPNLSKLEVQIPTEPTLPEVSSSPGGTKRLRKFKEGTLSPIAPLSPITLKIAKSKEGLEVVSSENSTQSVSSSDQDMGKVEKITLKLSSRDDSATIWKPNVEESVENRPEKLTLKLVKGESFNKFSSSLGQEEVEETKLEKITLKLSKGDSACIVKKKEVDTLSLPENEGGKLERITLKLSTDNNVCIVRPKDMTSHIERCASASPESGKVEKITLKVSKNDNVSIVKPSSPTPSTAGIEKLTLKVSKDGTAAVSAKQHDEFPRECESSKLEKITLKLSKDYDGVSIVRPVSPVHDRKAVKMSKEEPLSPLSPLVIARGEDLEPQKERITLKLSKAGGHPSPVGVTDERSSWSIKSNESDNVPSPVTSDPATPKARPKRVLNEILEAASVSAKRLKLIDPGKTDDFCHVVLETHSKIEEPVVAEDEQMDTIELSKVNVEISLDERTLEPEPEAPLTENSVDIILLDSEDSQIGLSPSTGEPITSSVVSDVGKEVSAPRIVRRKPRGRPRKQVLTPGATLAREISTQGNSVAEEIVQTPPKPKREKARPEPMESDRPKRSCKGREKPPPKPPAKPRGRAAALAKQKAELTIQPEEPQLFEEETRMSADCGGQSDVTVNESLIPLPGNGLVAKVMVPRLSASYISAATTPVDVPLDSPGPSTINEESQASQGSVSLISSTIESTPNRGNRKGRMEINVDPEAQIDFTVDMIAEYMWPPNNMHAEAYMVQEQISAFLGVKSFKRKYPNLQRRAVDHDERQYLLERRLVSETLCDLGLTALQSHEVLDVLCTDFPEKFEEYRRFTRERAQREFSSKQRALLTSGTTGKEDSKSKAMRNMASFNAMLNRSRKDQRRACFDLQSFAVHYPEERRRRMSIPNLPSIGAYPLALVPGQYTDYFKQYTAAELRYFPINTVLYGPLLPNEMMKTHAGGSDGSQTDSSDSSSSDSSSSDSDSSGSDSDSDSDSSSDSSEDSNSQMGPGPLETQETEVDRPEAVCRICSGDRLKNKLGRAEALIHCASCEKSGHLSCLELTVDMMPHIRKYAWHCTDCKLCAQCNDTADEDKMLFCDMCDRGYHIYCVGLRKVPEGRWHCQECALCASCGARDPGGTEELQAAQTQSSQDTPSKVDPLQWQHEFKKGDKGTRLYVRTLCVPCSKLWRKGRYCRLCWKCFTNQPEEEGLINCSICDRWMHADCCRKAGRVIDADKLSSYICELCQQKGVSKSPSKVSR